MERYDGGTQTWVLVSRRRFVWDGWKLLLELDATAGNVWHRKFTWGLDLAGMNGQVNSLEEAGTISGLLAVEERRDPPANSLHYLYLYDANGNVGQMLDFAQPTLTLVAKYRYDPYGNIVDSAGSYAAENPWRFSTKWTDEGLGLYYYGFRYYSPGLGRWLNRDPAGFLDDMNLYRFVRGTPTVSIDRLGLDHKTYSYQTAKPPCGFWIVCPVFLNRRGTGDEAHWIKNNIDETRVPGFEVTFFPNSVDLHDETGRPTVDYPPFDSCCCACTDEPPGAIRLVQVVKSEGIGAHVDIPDPEVNPDYPPGYTEAHGQGGSGTYSLQDTPKAGFNGNTHKFEVCAICQHNGKDKVMGCVTFSYFDGERGKKGADRKLQGLEGNKLKYKSNDCFGKKSNEPGKLFDDGIEDWKKK